MNSHTVDMLRARREEHIAVIGVVAGLFADDLPLAVERLHDVRAAARECVARKDRKIDSRARTIWRDIAEAADELITPLEQLAQRDAVGKTPGGWVPKP